MSGAFWRGCGAIAVLSIAGFSTLVSGGYKHNVAAPAVGPWTAALGTAVLAGIAFVVLWRWEQRHHDRQ